MTRYQVSPAGLWWAVLRPRQRKSKPIVCFAVSTLCGVAVAQDACRKLAGRTLLAATGETDAHSLGTSTCAMDNRHFPWHGRYDRHVARRSPGWYKLANRAACGLLASAACRRYRDALQASPGASRNRYPTPCSVTSHCGRAGSTSSFLRRLAMNTRT